MYGEVTKVKRVGLKSKRSPLKRWFDDLARPLSVFVILWLTIGFSTVGKAAEKVKRAAKTKKKTWKEAYESLLTKKAWAYFRPVWRTGEDLPTPPGYGDLVGDPDGRIEKPFRIHSAVRGRVAFWFDVYARFNSQFRIVHDKDNPELIYGYLDFRALYRAMPDRLARARARKLEKRVIDELKEQVAEAMDVTHPKEPRLAPEDREAIRALLAKVEIDKPEEAVKPIRRIRAQTGQKDAFLKGLHRSKNLLPQIEAIFKEKGLPVTLARLPFVESSFNPNAYSKAGAQGLWQFMAETAQRFNPRATHRELRDPLRQSKSAAKMFGILHEKFDDWGLAVTSYNSGAGRVKRIADANRVSDIDDLLRIPIGRGKLGFAGANFYCEFLAAVLTEAYQDRIFTTSEMGLASLDMPRRIQSLFGFSAGEGSPRVTTAKKERRHGVTSAKRRGGPSRIARAPRPAMKRARPHVRHAAGHRRLRLPRKRS